MKLYIKYMVSLRCKLLVKEELRRLGLHSIVLDLGMVEIQEEITPGQREQLGKRLLLSGLELMDDKKSILIEKTKNLIIEMIHYSKDLPKVNYSDYLSEKLGYDYTYLSNIFSEVKGITIQQFIIIHKIERVKELLLYNELTLTEISYQLHYSSVAHLSNQFKKVTGLSPSFYKKLKQKRKKTWKISDPSLKGGHSLYQQSFLLTVIHISSSTIEHLLCNIRLVKQAGLHRSWHKSIHLFALPNDVSGCYPMAFISHASTWYIPKVFRAIKRMCIEHKFKFSLS